MRRAGQPGVASVGLPFLGGALLGVALLGVGTPAARAQSPAQTQRAELEAARAAEEAFDPAEAMERYRAALEIDPSSRLARRARGRVRYLEERSEGGFAPLAELMRAQQARGDREALRRFAEARRGFPSGRVRQEGAMLLAESWSTLGDAEEALSAYREWLEEPELEEQARIRATAGLARLLEQEDRTDEAIAVLNEQALGDVEVGREIAAAQRTRVRRGVALGVLAGFALLLLALLRLRWLEPAVLRRAAAPRRLLVGAYVLLGPLAVAWLYDPSSRDTFGLLALTPAPLVFVASCAGQALGGAPRWKRWAVALGAVAAHAAAGYLVLVARGNTLGLAP